MRISPLLALISFAAIAQSGSRFSIANGTAGGGNAALSSGSRFQLEGAIIRPMAGVQTGSRFSIQGGFRTWPPLAILSAKPDGSSFVITFQTEMGNHYILQHSGSLASPDWQGLGDISGDGGIQSVSCPLTGATQGYYRLIQQ
jgi:hypothetical protein